MVFVNSPWIHTKNEESACDVNRTEAQSLDCPYVQHIAKSCLLAMGPKTFANNMNVPAVVRSGSYHNHIERKQPNESTLVLFVLFLLLVVVAFDHTQVRLRLGLLYFAD